MKKFLNISVIAALAILPLAANATPVAGNPEATVAAADEAGVTASNGPKYGLAQQDANVDGVVATAGYVKGAYNAAIKAINKVSETANSAVKGVSVNGSPLTLTNGIANVTVTESANNGKISVNGTDVAVTGLGSAAYTASTDYATAAQGVKADSAVQSVTTGETNGTIKVDGTAVSVYGLGTAAYTSADDYATAAQGIKADNAATLLGNSPMGTNATTVTDAIAEVKGIADNALTSAALTDYATKTGVETTVTNAFTGATATITSTTGNAVTSATVPVVTTWGATEPAATGVSVALTQTAVVTSVGETANVTAEAVAYPN